MASYLTPNVYIEEQSTLPKSIVTADTAVPAFVGYTQKALDNDGNDVSSTHTPVRISSLHQYESQFGLPETSTFTVNYTASTDSYTVTAPDLKYNMAHAVQLFYANGGGDCYIVSVGSNGSGDPSASELTAGLDKLNAEDGPTLVLMPDAVNLVTDSSTLGTAYGDYGTACDAMLTHCADLQDRFALLDVFEKPSSSLLTGTDEDNFRSAGVGTGNLSYGAAYYPNLKTNLSYVYDESSQTVGGDLSGTLASQTTQHYNNIKALLDAQTVTLPPSAAVAGVIANIDHNTGVWKAPANVSLNSVTEPSVKISDSEQASLNVDATAGKSINAIRAFNGKGVLVWGARTLAGNDNEWRYVNVRRLFVQIETDIKRATSFAVFEPNTAVTWARIKAMCESYLTRIYNQGGLAGASADEAFFISVGLGKTMTQDDILEGRLKVSVGLAVSRPAEFVIFTFTHMLQQP